MSGLARGREIPAWVAGIALSCLLGCTSGTSPGTGGIGSGPQACAGFCQDSAAAALSVPAVEDVVRRAIAEARARSAPATIAVVDRVGNVLAVYQMTGARQFATVRSPSGIAVSGGLEGVDLVPSAAAAIAKAVTAAYLSSEGNAFSTRTASQIVQEAFNPGESNQTGGPLFGVQFSQLPCSDLMARFGTGEVGPHRSPLGLAADPGGLPLYLNGTPVGGVGVIADGLYSYDATISDADRDIDELIAVAASFGLGAPRDRRADRITVDGKTLRFADVDFADLASNPASASSISLPAEGQLLAVPGYADAVVLAGTVFGQTPSGVRAASEPALAAQDAFVLVDGGGVNRFPARASTTAGGLTQAEVQSLMVEALRVSNRARAQIRRPLGTVARVSVSIVDLDGSVLALARGRDAPVFGIDVSLQKARTALLFSKAGTGAAIGALPPAGYIKPDLLMGDGDALEPVTDLAALELEQSAPFRYVQNLRSLSGQPTILDDGALAIANRSVGNLARPFYPDGIRGNPPGPLSLTFEAPRRWSPFSVGLQLDLGYNAIVQHVAFVANLEVNLPDTAPFTVPDVGRSCVGVGPVSSGFAAPTVASPAANGIQIFPGSVPIYRGSTLIGAIGVSGDGIEQDDMVAFLGLHNAASAAASGFGNAPAAIRIDQLDIGGLRPRYIQCPQAPFIDSTEQDVCANK